MLLFIFISIVSSPSSFEWINIGKCECVGAYPSSHCSKGHNVDFSCHWLSVQWWPVHSLTEAIASTKAATILCNRKAQLRFTTRHHSHNTKPTTIICPSKWTHRVSLRNFSHWLGVFGFGVGCFLIRRHYQEPRASQNDYLCHSLHQLFKQTDIQCLRLW